MKTVFIVKTCMVITSVPFTYLQLLSTLFTAIVYSYIYILDTL